jgi:nitrogen fixation protein FixH
MTTYTTRCAAIAAVTVGLAAGGCGKSEQANQAPAVTATAPAPSSAAAPAAEITFKSDSEPVKTGENTFEVMVMQDGKPVDDATVSAEFYMAAMPQMKMPEMRMKTDLASAGNGVYRGKGQVMMAGDWDVTVMAMRGGQELGSKKLTLTAK